MYADTLHVTYKNKYLLLSFIMRKCLFFSNLMYMIVKN